MSIPEVPDVPVPHCPHCDAQLPSIGMFNWACGPWVSLCLYCTACSKVLHMQVVPAAVMPVAEEPRVKNPFGGN